MRPPLPSQRQNPAGPHIRLVHLWLWIWSVLRHFSLHNSSVFVVGLVWLLFCCTSCRSTSVCSADGSKDHRAAGNYREGPIRGGVEREVERRRCGCEDLLFQRGALLVPWGWDLPDHHAPAREHLGLHCSRQQRWVTTCWFEVENMS